MIWLWLITSRWFLCWLESLLGDRNSSHLLTSLYSSDFGAARGQTWLTSFIHSLLIKESASTTSSMDGYGKMDAPSNIASARSAWSSASWSCGRRSRHVSDGRADCSLLASSSSFRSMVKTSILINFQAVFTAPPSPVASHWVLLVAVFPSVYFIIFSINQYLSVREEERRKRRLSPMMCSANRKLLIISLPPSASSFDSSPLHTRLMLLEKGAINILIIIDGTRMVIITMIDTIVSFASSSSLSITYFPGRVRALMF